MVGEDSFIEETDQEENQTDNKMEEEEVLSQPNNAEISEMKIENKQKKGKII